MSRGHRRLAGRQSHLTSPARLPVGRDVISRKIRRHLHHHSFFPSSIPSSALPSSSLRGNRAWPISLHPAIVSSTPCFVTMHPHTDTGSVTPRICTRPARRERRFTMFPDLLILLALLAPRPPLRGAGILSQVADPEGWGGGPPWTVVRRVHSTPWL